MNLAPAVGHDPCAPVPLSAVLHSAQQEITSQRRYLDIVLWGNRYPEAIPKGPISLAENP
jgi:hypothetical protein